MEQQKKSQIIQVVFLILLLAAVIGLFSAVVTIQKYADMLKNPLEYNIEQLKLKSCTCENLDGKIIFVNNNKLNLNFSLP